MKLYNKITILNEVYVFLNYILEKNLTLTSQQLLNYILANEHSDLSIQKFDNEFLSEINSLKLMISNFDDKSELVNDITLIVQHFTNITLYYNALSTHDLEPIQVDKLYYKAVLSNYFIENMIFLNKLNNFDSFKSEFFQVGVLIGQYYKDSNNNTQLIIKSKLNELFERYSFYFSLPSCCS